MLVVYPNRLDRSKREFTPVPSGKTLDDWMSEHIKGYYVSNTPPTFPTARTASRKHRQTGLAMSGKTVTMLTVVAEPKDPINIGLAIIAVVAAGAAVYAMTQIPDNLQNTTPEGSPIYDANAQGKPSPFDGDHPRTVWSSQNVS
ncbi:hypothetical protein P4S64_19025 [Vibrio sp. M60_M31a]